MGLIFSFHYQHHDRHLLEPIEQELVRRGHAIIHDMSAFPAFIRGQGNRALLLVGDHMVFGHLDGLSVVKQAHLSGIRSVSIQHGAAAAFPNKWDGPMKFAASVRCLWGDYWERWFSGNEMVVTGAPHMDDWEPQPQGDYALLVPAFREDAEEETLKKLDTEGRAEVYVQEARRLKFDKWMIRLHPSDMKHDDRLAACGYMATQLKACTSNPHEASLYDTLLQSHTVFGTSTVVFEGLALGREAVPIFMDYLPDKLDKHKLLGPLDGKASSRIVDVIEAQWSA